MKKRQVMALILAVALAVPSVSLGSSMAGGIPASVEAAANPDAGAITTTPNYDVAGDVAVSDGDNKRDVEAALKECFEKPVKFAEGQTVGNVITVGGNWTLKSNSNQKLTPQSNKVTLTYTWPAETSATDVGNEWAKNEKGYYADFDITFEAVELLQYGNVLDAWPELANKTYDPAKETFEDVWGEDVKKVTNDKGTFSIIKEQGDDNSATQGDKTVKVAFSLNSGYAFAAKTGGGDVRDIAEGAKRCVKTYSLNIAKQTIKKSDVTFPKTEVDGTKLVKGTKMSDAISVSAPKAEDLIKYTLVKKDQVGNYNALAASDVFSVGKNPYYIKAELNTNNASAGNYQFENAATSYISEEQSVDVGKVTLKEVSVKAQVKATDKATWTDVTGGGTLPTGQYAYQLVAEDNWSVDGFDPANATGNGANATHVKYTYKWYKGGTLLTGAGTNGKELGITESAGAGSYSCAVAIEYTKDTTHEEDSIWEQVVTPKESDKFDVAFSDLVATIPDAVTAIPTAEYGKISNLEYKYTVESLPVAADVKLIVKQDGKDITAQVGKLFTLKRDGENLTVAVDKSIAAGTYGFAFRIINGNDSFVILAPTHRDAGGTGTPVELNGYECVVDKQVVNVNATKNLIEATETQEYGTSLDKLAFEYNLDTENGNGIQNKAIADKITITLNEDFKKTVTKGYLSYNGNGNADTTGDPASTDVTVDVSLKDKDNYKLKIGSNAPVETGKATVANVAVKMKKKPIKLSVETIEPLVQGNALPISNINVVGKNGFLEKDKIEVVVNSYTLFDKSADPIKSGIASLPAGDYTIDADFGYSVEGTSIDPEDVGYAVTTSKSALPIYTSVHTIGFVTYGDTNLPNKEVGHGDVLAKPADPTRAGYKFAGWYTDKDFKNAYDFSKAVEGDFNLYAKWEKVSATNGGQNSADAVKAGTTTKTSAGTFAVINASTRTVAYKAASKSAKKVTVPSSVTIKGVSYKVTKIDNNAFKNCKKLTKVSIPSTVTEIGTAAFKGCKKLTSVTIPKNVNKIGKEAFSGCSKLKKVTIKSTKIKSVGKNAFKGISKKSAIKTPKSKKAAYKKILKKSGYKKTVK